MTFGGSTAGTYDDVWTWHSDNKGVIGKMPNSGSSSLGVTSVAVNDNVPSFGSTYKFVPSVTGTLTINGKGGGGSGSDGKFYLVQVDNANKITAIVWSDYGTANQTTHTFTLTEGNTYYFLQCAVATDKVKISRYTLKSISYQTITAVSEATTWDFSSLTFTKNTTDGQLLQNSTFYVGANTSIADGVRAIVTNALTSAPTALGADMFSFKTAVAGQVLMRLSNWHGVVNVSDGTSDIQTYGTSSTETYHGGNSTYTMATFNAEAEKQYYVYASTLAGNQKTGLYSVSFYPTTNTTTAITENTEWNFATPVYTVESYGGITKDNIYLGSGLKQVNTTRLLFLGQGNTSTGANTIQFKIPANKNLWLQIKPSCYNGDVVLTDGTNTLKTFESGQGKDHQKEIYVNVASSASERTLYLYTTKSDVTESNTVGIYYIKAYFTGKATTDSYGYTTFAAPYPLDLSEMPTGLKAYKAQVSGTRVNFTEVNAAVPANTGLLLEGAASTDYNIPVATTGTISDNAFLVNTSGATIASTESTYYFGMIKDQTTLTFGKISDTGFIVPSDKAYLSVPASNFPSGTARLTVSFGDEETTGIQSVNGSGFKVQGDFYDLQGRRIDKPAKGLYIVNGKKVVIK